MDLVIRHVKEQDHEAVHEILTSPHVLSGSMRVPFAPLQQTRERLTPRAGSTSWWLRPRIAWSASAS
jgi:hypothetical protein